MKSLEELLPQAHPMILLSGYTPPSPDSDVVDAWVDVSAESPFFEAELDGVPACVAAEYMAQTMALCTGLYRARRNLPPKVGFLLGSRRLTLNLKHFAAGSRYRVRVAPTFSDEEFGSFACTIFEDATGKEVASAQMNAFQPEGELAVDKLEAYT